MLGCGCAVLAWVLVCLDCVGCCSVSLGVRMRGFGGLVWVPMWCWCVPPVCVCVCCVCVCVCGCLCVECLGVDVFIVAWVLVCLDCVGCCSGLGVRMRGLGDLVVGANVS